MRWAPHASASACWQHSCFCCSYVKKLMVMAVFLRAGGALGAGEVALEAANGLPVGLAFGGLAGDVVAGLGVAAGAGDRDAVDGGVDLAVAAAIEAVAVGVARAGWDRGQPGGAGELGIGGEPAGAGDLADELGRSQGSEAGLAEQLRRHLGDEPSDLSLERLDRL